MNKFFATKDVIPNVPILIVDIEQEYLEDEDVYGLISSEYHDEVKLELKERMDLVYESLKVLDNKLYTVHHSPLYHKIASLPINDLNHWLRFEVKGTGEHLTYDQFKEKIEDDIYYGMLLDYILHENVYESLSSFDKVLVCGLWKDRCVFEVTKRLNEKGVNAILLDNDNFSICSELIGDGYSLDNLTKYHKLKLKYI